MTNLPAVEERAGKRGITAPFLWKNLEPFVWSLNWTDQNVWRRVVQLQPIALLCRETIVERISTMEWRIEPKDPTQRSELQSEIDYYTQLFEYNRNQNFDSTYYKEWILGDALDLPFGAGTELIYEEDNPFSRLLDYVPLDGATLYPTFNNDVPVVQRVPSFLDTIPFPRHSINRLYYSPRREIEWRGWGMPPPQKIFAAINMISKGDEYYWKFLVDTPEAGILDLIDMSKDSAEDWLEAFRALLTGVDPLKIPVLYEHTQPAKYIPFGRPPAEIMLNDTVTRYAAIVASGYGLTLSSLGFQEKEEIGVKVLG
jgi:hypothetical protein